MKKEIIVACVLALLLAAAVINIHFINKLTENVVGLIEDAAEFALDEDWAKAEMNAEEAADLWTNSDTYTHLVLRHPELEAATDAIYGFLEEIYAKEAGAAAGAAKAAAARLKSIASLEQIKFGSVF